MRLIDADKLYPDCMTKEGTLAISQSQIANAPTVDTTCPNCDRGYAQGYSDGYLKGKEDRPQGEWEWVQYDANPNIGNWHCSECRYIPHGKKEYQKTNYCPNCGADMRGAENDN